MNIAYPNLVAEMSKRRITRKSISKELNISYRTLHNKIYGITPFTWNETSIIKNSFFPDMKKDVLFWSPTDTTQTSA